MRVHTLTVLQLHDDITRYTMLVDDGYEYSGPFDLMKKGREQVEANMKSDADTAKQNRANSQAQYGNANSLEQEEMGNTTPGSLSPAAGAQLAADRDNIQRTYNGIRQTAFRTLGQRGFGSAPSGFRTAAENGINVGQEGADTGAYRNAQVNTQNQRQDAEHVAAGMSGTEGNLGNTASGESTTAAVDRNKMGSTFSDVMGGIAQLAPIVAAPFTGGASLALSGMGNPFSKIGKGGGGGGVGGYSPGTSMA